MKLRVHLCSTFLAQNEAFETRLVQNTVASFLIFVESLINGNHKLSINTPLIKSKMYILQLWMQTSAGDEFERLLLQ